MLDLVAMCGPTVARGPEMRIVALIDCRTLIAAHCNLMRSGCFMPRLVPVLCPCCARAGAVLGSCRASCCASCLWLAAPVRRGLRVPVLCPC